MVTENMKLDRNINPDGRGKYALVKLRELDPEKFTPEVFKAVDMLIDNGIVDLGNTQETEFFVIRLRDKYAAAALDAYSMAAFSNDPEWAAEVQNLAKKAAEHPNKKNPD